MDPREPKSHDASDDPKRRPYTTPRLRRLGSVRDLTLGSPLQAGNDQAGGKKFM